MRIHRVVVCSAVVALAAGAALAQESLQSRQTSPDVDTQPPASSQGRLFYGGYVGLAFGTVRYVEFSPLVGYRFTEDLGAGIGVFYRYRDDRRYDPSVSASDYGGNVFLRYHIGSGVFAQAEYDSTSYEYLANSLTGATARETYNGVLAGFGYSAAVGRGAGAYFVVLYDFNYQANNLHNPYSSPVQYRFGVSVGF